MMEHKKNPKVSIIIPVYNGANYLKEAIDSAIAQTYDNIEIIVVNDGSSDNGETEKIALKYGDKIRYFLKENGGSSSALNYGIKMMQGDYFSWLSHDDLYKTDRVKKMVEKLDVDQENSQVIVCGSELIDKDGNEIFHPSRDFDCILNKRQMFEFFKNGYKINGCGILFSKKIIDEVGFFDENLCYVNDVDYWYRLAIQGCTFIFFSDSLVKSRIHGGQVTVKKANLFKTESKQLAKKIFDSLFKNIDNNLDLICIYMKKAAYDDNLDVVKYYIGILKKKKKFNYIWYATVSSYYVYGKIIKLLKVIYKKIFFKR